MRLEAEKSTETLLHTELQEPLYLEESDGVPLINYVACCQYFSSGLDLL